MKFNIVQTDLSWFEVDTGYNYSQVYHPLMWGHWNGKVEDSSAKSCFPLFRCRDYWTEILAGLATGKDQPEQYRFTYEVEFGIDTERTKLVVHSPEKGFDKLFKNLNGLKKYLSNFHDEDITLYYDEARQLILLDASYWWMNSHSRIGLLTGCIRIKHDYVNMQAKDVLGQIGVGYNSKKGKYDWLDIYSRPDLLQYILNYNSDSDCWIERVFAVDRSWASKDTPIFKYCEEYKNPGNVHGFGNVRTAVSFHMNYNPEFKELLKVKEAA